MALVPMNSDEFEAAVASGAIVLAYFWTDWHEACREVTPILEEVLPKYAETVVACSINADQEGFLALEIGVHATPLVILYQDGEELDRIPGIQLPRLYDQLLDDLVNPKEVNPYDLIQSMGYLN